MRVYYFEGLCKLDHMRLQCKAMQVSAFFFLPCWFCCWPLLGALLDSWLYLDRAYPLCSCPTFNLLLCIHVLYLTVASVFV
jgi:hypothetical protein